MEPKYLTGWCVWRWWWRWCVCVCQCVSARVCVCACMKASPAVHVGVCRHLNLQRNKLSGTLSGEVFPTSMQSLLLGENALSGSLPRSLCQRMTKAVCVLVA